MREWFQSVVGMIITGLVLAGCFIYFSVQIATRSHPRPYTESSAGVRDSTRIYRNTFGIPHIVAKNEHDMFFAQGYAHAQDRLWQMDVWRRIGRGKLAEIRGREAIPVDLFMRGIGIAAIAKKQIDSMSKTTRNVLSAYAEGVNAYIEANRHDLPFEFDALEYMPTPWTMEDCIVVGRVLSFELSQAFWSDLTYAQIAAQCGIERARMYIPSQSGGPFVLDTTSSTSLPVTPVADSLRNASTASTAHAANGNTADVGRTEVGSVIQATLRTMACVREQLGLLGSSVGSNCWVVKSDSGNVIIANDPHMGIGLPPKWVQMHLSCPGFNAVGMSIPGLPLVFSGRNNTIGWGFSNAMVDDVDYILEKIDPANGNYYMAPGAARKRFRYVVDTLHIKGAPDTLVSLRYTNRGCVISDVHIMKTPSVMFESQRQVATTLLAKSCLTMRWTARYASDEILAMYRINKAQNFNAVQEAVRTWYSPALNISIGTVSGTIATVVAGIAPIRGTSDAHFLVPGNDGAADWQGVQHLRTWGSLVNPARGFILSANNATLPRPQFSLGTLFEPSSRAERIYEQLKIYRDYTARDAQVMQQDVVSKYARNLTDNVKGILQRGSVKMNPVEKQCLKMLARWDGAMSQVDGTASIWSVFFQKLVYDTFEDELGSQLYADYMFVSSIPTRKIAELTSQPAHILWDDIRTPQKEDMGWIVMRAFNEAVSELRATMGNDDPTTWRYDNIHTISFDNLFGKNALMAPVTNHGPFGIGGSSTTINNTEWSMWSPYSTRVCASMRLISDLSDTIQYAVVPGGTSGQPLDAHYADQIQLWLKGGYVRVPVKPEPDVSFRLYNTFTPDR